MPAVREVSASTPQVGRNGTGSSRAIGPTTVVIASETVTARSRSQRSSPSSVSAGAFDRVWIVPMKPMITLASAT